MATSRLIPSHWRSVYTGVSLMTITTMYDGYQFTSVIYDDSVSLASPHVSSIPGGTLHGQEDESCVFKHGNITLL